MESVLKVVILHIFLSAFMVADGEALRITGHTEEDFETVRFTFNFKVRSKSLFG